MRYFYSVFLYIIAFASIAAPSPSIKFIRNEGQWESNIRFRADIPGGYLLVKNTGIQYVFFDTKTLSDIHTGL